jgi:hypothetical protein
MLFGDNFRYAWVGVNGAIALSKTATDTNDANSNGYYASFDFPDQGVWGKRADTANQSDMPPMFIAPFWADHIIGDTLAQYGHIFYGNGGDTCQFIVEWDSIGTFDDLGASADETKFRLILNRCTGVVEFQYDLAGTNGLDTNNLSGMQGDSNFVSGPVPGWVYLNRNGNPPETRIHDGSCVKFYPNISTVALDGWNMVGVSLTPNDANYGKAHLFPQAVSQAFRYSSGYTAMDPLEKGTGVWMKFNGTDGVGANAGTLDQEVTATVQDKWNMISGPSGLVDSPGDIIVTGTTVSSNYFGYGAGGYYTATMIQPGKSYWVKTDGPGTISMNSSSAAPKTVPLATAETDLW